MTESAKQNPGIALRRGIAMAMLVLGTGCTAPPPQPTYRLANGGRPLNNPQGVCVQIGVSSMPGNNSACYQLAPAAASEHIEPLPLDEFGYLFPPLKPQPILAPVPVPSSAAFMATPRAQPVPIMTTSILPSPVVTLVPVVPPVVSSAPRLTTRTLRFSTSVPFQLNSAHLARSNRAALVAFVNTLGQYRGVVSIRITGHTDRSGPVRFNQWLSLMRAKSVELRLLSMGADPRSIQLYGAGSTEPRAHARTPADNRYIDIEAVVRIPSE